MTKTFKIGEYAKGGIIKVVITKSRVTLYCMDYFTKEVLFTLCSNNFRELSFELQDWTSIYYADEIMNYILSNATLEYAV